MDLLKAINAARRVSTPLVVIRTPDSAATVRTVTQGFLDEEKKLDVKDQVAIPVIFWDIMRGMSGYNQKGKDVLAGIIPADKGPVKASARPTDCLELALTKLSGDTILFMDNLHEVWNGDSGVLVRQAVWNLRDPFKARGNMLIVLANAGARVPDMLANDVLVLDESLPDTEQLTEIIHNIYRDTKLKLPEQAVIEKALDAMSGLSAFPAEQTLAMCLTKGGLDTDELWERKRQVIEQTPGLTVGRSGEKFSKIGGVQNAKDFGRAILEGKQAPRGVVFIDEIEKALAGFGTDSSGVKTEMVGTLLTWMQECEADGILLIGPPGCTKSMYAKAFGNEGAIPTITCDLAAMQDSLVGKTGDRLRGALKVIDAVTGGRPIVIATCNRIGALPPELRRRFTLGTFFFDLPTEEEREVIWDIYLKKYKLDEKMKRPKDANWTGSEIKECCRKAWRLNMSLKEAATYIVPVAVSAWDEVENLRRMAHGRFISASRPGVYVFDGEEDIKAPSVAESSIRMIRVDPNSVGRA